MILELDEVILKFGFLFLELGEDFNSRNNMIIFIFFKVYFRFLFLVMMV